MNSTFDVTIRPIRKYFKSIEDKIESITNTYGENHLFCGDIQ